MDNKNNIQIGILRSPLANIGEEVVLRGGEYLLRTVFNDADIIEISGYPGWVNYRQAEFGVIKQLSQRFLPITLDNKTKFNFTDPSLNYELDLLVVTGCSFYPAQLDQYKPILDKYSQKQTPIVFLGTGSTDYSTETVSEVRRYLSYYDVLAISTRDRAAFKRYQDIPEIAIDGIDLGFFINNWYTPPKSPTEYITLTFDKLRDLPDVQADQQEIAAATHDPFDDPFVNKCSQRFLKKFGISIGYDTKLREVYCNFISDDLKDYLRLYRNSQIVHSDRMHACVPALVYGNKAQLHLKSDRAKLFKRVMDEDIYNGASVDEERLNREKKELVESLSALRRKVTEL